MKSLFTIRNLFLFNGLLEMSGGVLVLLYPSLLLIGSPETTETVAIGKMYGLAAFLLGVVSYQCYKSYDENNNYFKIIYLSFTIFHVLLGFQLYGNYQIGIINHPGPFILHLSVAFILITAFLISKK